MNDDGRYVEPGYGYIIYHQIRTDLGHLWMWYEWRGGPRYRISTYDMFFDDAWDEWHRSNTERVVRVGPYRLKLIGMKHHLLSFEAVRMDSFGWQFIYWFYHATKWYHEIESRFIMTLSIWWMAEYHPSRYVSWSDVFIIKRMKGWFKWARSLLQHLLGRP